MDQGSNQRPLDSQSDSLLTALGIELKSKVDMKNVDGHMNNPTNELLLQVFQLHLY